MTTNWYKLGAVAGGGLFTIVVAICFVGFLLPKDIALETSVEIDAPRAEIFPYFDTQAGIQTWWNALADAPELADMPPMDVIAVDGPTAGAGARIDFAVGGTVTEHWTVLESVPLDRVVYEVDFLVFQVERTLTLTVVDAATTRVRWSETGELNNPIFRWFALLEGEDGVLANFDMALGGVKKLAEAP